MPTTAWRQYNIVFSDRVTAEQVAVGELRPTLSAAQDAGLLHSWWFVRKHPWRLRYLPDDPSCLVVADLLDELAAAGRIRGWTSGIYEPETLAFGGPEAMDIAHELFHLDSRHLLDRAASLGPTCLGRRETAVVLTSALMRGAGLDRYEQGDVWAKVAELRPAAPEADPGQTDRLLTAMARLMSVDTRPLRDPGVDWVAAFEHAGRALADLADHGRLQRGLRAVAAHHVIFHTNRAGLPLADQSTLAALATEAVFTAGEDTSSSPAPIPTTPKVNQ